MEIQWPAHLGQQGNRVQGAKKMPSSTAAASEVAEVEVKVEQRSDSHYLSLILSLNLLRAGRLFQHPTRTRSILLPGRQLEFVSAPFLAPSSHTLSQSL